MEEHEHKELQPQRGEYQATVKESTDLLKKLAEFNSKKEEVLKRISSIGARMEERLGPLGAGASAANGTSSFKENAMPEFLKTHTQHMPDPFTKIAYTRTRETPKPVFAQGCLEFFMPNKKAITDEWIELAKNGQSDPFSITNEGIMLPPGCAMCIPTGIRLALPKDLALLLMCKKGLSLTFPTVFTEQLKDEELIVSIVNESVSEIPLIFETHLFMGYPVHLENNLSCDELLNSTYEDWVHGTING